MEHCNDEWLRLALMDAEWVSQQRAAWEPLCKPGSLGAKHPRFVLLSEQNPETVLAELAIHFQQLAQRHLATAQAIGKMHEDYPVILY